ncbi:MAG: hypothetical protein K2N48_08880 [Muribaculaceae bacterium]|nr:hypothetical protein [Muribaculaceae bacterium]
MKKLFILLMLSPLLSVAQSAPEPPDTIKMIKNPEKVTVTRTGETTLITVDTPTDYGSDTFIYEVAVADSAESDLTIDFEIPFGIGKKKENGCIHRKLQTSMFMLGNLYVGQRFNYSDKGNVRNSYEVGIRNFVGIRWSHGPFTPSFSIGIGFGVQRYSAQKGFLYATDGSNLMLNPTVEGSRVRLTDLQVWNFQVPLLFTIPIGREVEFQAGAVGCFNSYAKARTELDFGDYKSTTSYKGLQQRLFTAELTASLGVCDIIGVYASWSPMTLFQAPYGPQLKSWSIGATINF